MSMDDWMPEPCATDTETVADTEDDKAIRIVIGNAKTEGSNELWGN